MIDLILLAALVVGFYVGWNIGSNDAANAMGVPVGGRAISYRQAISILVIFVLLGAFLEGWKVMQTVGTGIVVSPGGNPLMEVPELAVVALFSAGVWVTIVTTLRLPVSTSQAIVGSVIGAGLLLSISYPGFVSHTVVRLGVISEIGVAWVLTPIGAAFFSYLIYEVFSPLLRRIGTPLKLTRILKFLVISAGAFAAYSLGANTVGNATAMIYVVAGNGGGIIGTSRLVALFGGTALAIGAITYSKRVMNTVGKGITSLDAMTAFSAQFGAALTVWLFTQLGIPVSTSQAIVGGVIGAGLVKGTATVSKSKVRNIVIAWVLTPTVTAGLTFALGWVMYAI